MYVFIILELMAQLFLDARPNRSCPTHHLRERRHSIWNRVALRLWRSLEAITRNPPMAQALKQLHQRAAPNIHTCFGLLLRFQFLFFFSPNKEQGTNAIVFKCAQKVSLAESFIFYQRCAFAVL